MYIHKPLCGGKTTDSRTLLRGARESQKATNTIRTSACTPAAPLDIARSGRSAGEEFLAGPLELARQVLAFERMPSPQDENLEIRGSDLSRLCFEGRIPPPDKGKSQIVLTRNSWL